jgi:anti-sigma-K factor RskA
MTTREDIEVLAGEYVLGTLAADERNSVAARRLRERELDQAIEAWERRLAPLDETIRPVHPRHSLLGEIQTRITVRQVFNVKVAELEHRVRRWRHTAYAATALAASLAVVIGIGASLRPASPSNYVAVFQKGDASPAFLLSIDLKTRVLSIQAIAAAAEPGKSYQLWIAADPHGGAPQSLGLIEDHGSATRRILTSYDPGVVERATFGVSLEPAGGSPTGRPTGPVFHAKLIPAPK